MIGDTVPLLMVEELEPVVQIAAALTDGDRRIARSLRDTARVVAAAGLPSEYRTTAFAVIAPLFIARSTPDRDPDDVAAAA